MASGEDKQQPAQRGWIDKVKKRFSLQKKKSSPQQPTNESEGGTSTEPEALAGPGSDVPVRAYGARVTLVRLNDGRKSYRRSRVPSVSGTRCLDSLDLPSPRGYDEARVQGSQESLHRFASLEGLDVHEQQLTESTEQPYSRLPVTMQPSAEVTHSDCEGDPPHFPHQDTDAAAELPRACNDLSSENEEVLIAAGTMDTAGPPSPATSIDDDVPYPEQSTAVVTQSALSIEETQGQASGPFKVVPGITVCKCQSEEECPHSQRTSWEGVFTNEGEIRLYMHYGGGVGRHIKYPPMECSTCMPPYIWGGYERQS